MPGSGFDYDHMVEEAMRGVAARALAEAAAHGLPGDHHFYVAFRTHDEGVLIPAHLKATYPEEIWWRRRVPPPGPQRLCHRTFIAIAA